MDKLSNPPQGQFFVPEFDKVTNANLLYLCGELQAETIRIIKNLVTICQEAEQQGKIITSAGPEGVVLA
jgi:hypothetical protein